MPPENVRTSASRNFSRLDGFEQVVNRASRSLDGNAVELRVNHHILLRRQFRIGGERLRNHAEYASNAVRVRANVVPADARRA